MRVENSIGGDMPWQAEPARPHDLGELVWNTVYPMSRDIADNN
jgi:hypothetical protein